MLEKDIFSIIHNKYAHAGFHRAYDTIIASVYIRNLSRRLRIYINHYTQYQLLQTTRYTLFEALHPIVGPPIPFYIVTADFILALPKIKDGKNCILTITCKFSKKIELIPEKDIYIVAK